MKPTSNQLLAAWRESETAKYYNFAEKDPESVFPLVFCVVPENLVASFVQRLTSTSEWSINVRIASPEVSKLPENVRKTLQVPIEPFENVDDCIIALASVMNERHPITLRNYPGERTLLQQASDAKIVINRYIPTGNTSAKGTPLVQLDPASVLLSFELAGIPAPKDYATWRTPNEDDCPSRANVRGGDALGTVLVHYHNGMMALVTSGDGMRAELIHVNRLESTAQDQIAGLIATNASGKKRGRPEKEISADDLMSEAAKWLPKRKEKVV
jgi:hypothetical protein